MFIFISKVLKEIFGHFIAVLFRAGCLKLSVFLVRMNSIYSIQPYIYRIMSVKQGAKMLSAKSFYVYRQRYTTVYSPSIFMIDKNKADVVCDHEKFELPDLAITIFNDISIVGGSEMLCIDNKVLLYDEIALGNPDFYGCKAFGIIPAQRGGLFLPAVNSRRVIVFIDQDHGIEIPKGISLCKDHSKNYFHWLLECLPRAIIALRSAECAGFPLLVDADLPTQCLQSLELIAGDRKIIQISHRVKCHVKVLAYPGVFSFMRDNYSYHVSPNDFLVAPEAIRLVREAFLPNEPKKVFRKIYIARDGARYRRLLNEDEIQEFLIQQGVEIVRPEKLSFLEQVSVFSEALLIIAPTGAGLSNMIFSPAECRIIVFSGDSSNANYYIFSQIASLLNQNLIYIVGKSDSKKSLHSNYKINIEDLRSLLRQFS